MSLEEYFQGYEIGWFGEWLLIFRARLGHFWVVFKSLVRSGYWVPNMVTETLTG